jgi:YgiT-type zinc finger domain-containing protein
MRISTECPWCGETMRLKEREMTDRIPGTSQTRTKKTAEWVCPSCDHFEEADLPVRPD